MTYTLKDVAKDIRTIIAGTGWFDCEDARERLWKSTEEILGRAKDNLCFWLSIMVSYITLGLRIRHRLRHRQIK